MPTTNSSTRLHLGALAQGLERLEGFLQKTGSGGYAVGNQHTIADIHIFAHITFMGSGFWDGVPTDFSDRFARITSIRQKIASHELIKKYYDSKGEKNKYDDLYIAARNLPTSGECPKEFKWDKVGGPTKYPGVVLALHHCKNIASLLTFMCVR